MSLLVRGFPASISLGGISIPLTQAILLNGVLLASSKYQTLIKAAVAYQVPTGYKLVILSGFARTDAGAFNSMFIGYGDTAVNDSAGAPTNSVNWGVSGVSVMKVTLPSTIQNQDAPAIFFEVPAGKYVWAQVVTNTSTTVQLLGYLVKV